jgi:hypothetical protein
MSFAYKTLKGSDTTQAPYVANKQYTFPSSSLSSSNIVVYTGEYDPQYMISGTVYNAFDPINDIQDNGYYRRLIFDSIQKLYYQNYISGSQSGMFFVSSAYDNYDQTTLVSGAMAGAVVKILNNYTASGGKYGTDYYDSSSYAILEPTKIRVISIPQDIYGNGIKPNTFSITSSTYDIRDDGQGNLYDYLATRSFYDGTDKYQQSYYSANADGTYVGNIVYSPGFAIITNRDYLCFYPSSPIARNDNYTILNVSSSKVLPILLNDTDDCKEIDDATVMTYPLDGYTFPSFSIVGGEIHITDCGDNNLQVTPGTYKILYTVNNTEGVVSNKATCSLYLQSNKLTSSLINFTSGCFNDLNSQTASFTLDLGIPPYSYSLDNSSYTPLSQQYGGRYGIAYYNTSSYAYGISGITDCGLYQPTFSINIPTSDNVNVYFKDVAGTIISYSLDTRMLPTIPNSSHLDTCLNQSTGWISASATGGYPVNTLSASIQSGSYNSGYFPLTGGSHVFAGLNSGSYTVTWKDGSNCTTSSTEVITTPPLIVVSVQAVEADCPSDTGTPSGGIAVNVSGGSGNYNYRWWNGSSFVKFVEDPTGLAAGTYNLYVSDSTGCNSTTSSNIVVDALTVIGFSGATIDSPLCYGGVGSITGGTLSGGSGSLIPTWNGPSGFVSNSVNIINLPAGNYYLTASDTLTGCYHTFGPYTVTQPTEFKSSSFSYTSSIGATGINTFNAIFTGGTPPYTAYLYSSSSLSGLTFVTSSSGTGTIPMIPNVCYTQDTYWALDAYDANGCHMTNYYSGAQLYVPTQVTTQQVVYYSTGANDSNVCGGTSGSLTTFYISSSDTTSPTSLFLNFADLIASGTLIYEDCKLLSKVPSGSYYGNQSVVNFSPAGAGTIISSSNCSTPQLNQITINVVSSQFANSTTFVSTTFETPNPATHYYTLNSSVNPVTSSVYDETQSGYLDITADVYQLEYVDAYITVTMDVYQDGYLLPPFPFYFTCQVVNGANYTRFFFPELFIDADHFYRVDIQYAVGYGPNCSEVPG